jgi:hypothetical protein
MRCVITTYHVNALAMVIARLKHSHAVNFATRPTAPHRAISCRIASHRSGCETPTEVFLVSAGGTGPKIASGSDISRRKAEKTRDARSREKWRIKGTRNKRCVLGSVDFYFRIDARQLVSNQERVADRHDRDFADGRHNAFRPARDLAGSACRRTKATAAAAAATATAATCELVPLISADGRPS